MSSVNRLYLNLKQGLLYDQLYGRPLRISEYRGNLPFWHRLTSVARQEIALERLNTQEICLSDTSRYLIDISGSPTTTLL